MSTTIIIYTITGLAGIAIGWFIASYQYIQKKIKQLAKREEIIAELSAVKQQAAMNMHWRDKYELLNNELHNLRDINSTLEADLCEVTAKLESMQFHTEDKIRQITSNEQSLSERFENLANRIFEQSTRRVDEQNQQSLNTLLAPLREQLDGFHRQVQEGFAHEARERHTLTYEIRNLQQLNVKIAQEAVNLTKALKGNNKIQGNWGEMILARVLESSGLRDGYEYETQVNLEAETCSQHMQPDVIVRLPHGKDVIIDAKIALVAYERYFNTEDECVRASALQEHITSIRNHIRLLGRKNYQHLSQLRTLDYVLMFIPIEPAFLLAMDKQPELITEALKNNIMLVSPTTLLVALRTIANLWNYEHQSKNVQQIAERASKLYDKIRLFVDDMLSIGHTIERTQYNYHQAMKKLTSGRGNLLAQVESFRSLGVEIKREINSELIKKATTQDKEVISTQSIQNR